VAAVTPILSTRGLTRRFGGLTAVNGVDLSVSAGEVRALIGPNGAGKTTLVSMLIGRIAPSSGRILLDGRDVTTLPAYRRVALGMGYTFQITSVFARLSVHENVALAVRRAEASEARVDALVAATLARVGLGGQGDQTAADLSYGHQRLLEVAMGLAGRPRVLILDEPTQGLAEAEIAGFKALIRGLVPETTVLLIEHNMGVVMELADRITVLNFGAVLAEGTPDDIRANSHVQAAYLGTGDA
jgi:branched-chain amino acid transport system ATP-binding protein